ncbi:MAG: sigma-70 family RNA polymerase sigma factor [Brevinematales bacterium]|jgi:RNA polymerase sigma-70 factor (ECF subfamily)
MEEREIIREAKRGNSEAFGQLIDLYKKLVFSFAYYHLRNRADAEDITQEVFWRVFSYISKFDEKRKFFSWLYAIEMNILATFIKKKMKHKKAYVDQDFLENIVFDEKDHMSPEDRIVLFDAIGKLSAVEQSLIYMKYNEDCSIKEIAETFNLTEENVKVKLFRTKGKLGRILGKETII